jgi:hypothetical protein
VPKDANHRSNHPEKEAAAAAAPAPPHAASSPCSKQESSCQPEQQCFQPEPVEAQNAFAVHVHLLPPQQVPCYLVQVCDLARNSNALMDSWWQLASGAAGEQCVANHHMIVGWCDAALSLLMICLASLCQFWA